MYSVVFVNVLCVKISEHAVVRNKAIDLALRVLPNGTRDILGLWIEGTKKSKLWMKVFNELATRGVADPRWQDNNSGRSYNRERLINSGSQFIHFAVLTLLLWRL